MRTFVATAAALLVTTTATSMSPSPHADRDHGRSRAQDAIAIFVDRQSPPGGDGSRRAPYPAIARALELAREIRARSRAPIVVRVAPGEYEEEFPLYLDVSQLELRGSTQLIEDKDGLPRNCGTANAVSPCIEPGSETVIASATPLATRQVLLAIAPTMNSPSDRVSDVTVQGFVVDGRASNVAA